MYISIIMARFMVEFKDLVLRVVSFGHSNLCSVRLHSSFPSLSNVL